MVICKPREQWEELVASSYCPYAQSWGVILAICSQMASQRRAPSSGLLVIVSPLLFRSPHLQVRFPACLQKKWAAQGKRDCVGTLSA